MAIETLPDTQGEFDEDLEIWKKQFLIHQAGTWRSQLLAILSTPFHALRLHRPLQRPSGIKNSYVEVRYDEDGLFDQQKQECGPCSAAGLVRTLTGKKNVDPLYMEQRIPPTFISGDTHPIAMEIGVERAGIRTKAYDIGGMDPTYQRHFFHQNLGIGRPMITLTRFTAGGMNLGRHYDLGLSFDRERDTISGYNSYYGKRRHFMKGSDADRPGNFVEPMELYLNRIRSAHVGLFMYRGYVLTGTLREKRDKAITS